MRLCSPLCFFALNQAKDGRLDVSISGRIVLIACGVRVCRLRQLRV